MNRTHSRRKVAELLSQRLDEPLKLLDRMRLRMHLSMCGNCSNVEQQIDCVHALSADLFSAGLMLDDDDENPAETCRPSAR